MEVSFSPSFLRSLHALPSRLQEEAVEKIEAFADEKNHRALRVHKLAGRLAGCHSFSVNYHIRILFQHTGKPKRAFLLAIGDHEVYNQ